MRMYWSAAAAAAEKEEGEVDDKPSPTESEGKEKAKEGLKIDTAAVTPVEFPRRRPGPLDISAAQKQGIPQGLPSALATARIIEDISTISYPEGIKSPKVELNVHAKSGKFR